MVESTRSPAHGQHEADRPPGRPHAERDPIRRRRQVGALERRRLRRPQHRRDAALRGRGEVGAPVGDRRDRTRGNAEHGRLDRQPRSGGGRAGAEHRRRQRVRGEPAVGAHAGDIEGQAQRWALRHGEGERHLEGGLIALALDEGRAVGDREHAEADAGDEERGRQRRASALAAQRDEREPHARRPAPQPASREAQQRPRQPRGHDRPGEGDEAGQQGEQRIGAGGERGRAGAAAGCGERDRAGDGQRRQVEAAHRAHPQVGAGRALARDEHRRPGRPGQHDDGDAGAREDRVAQHRRRAHTRPVGGDRDPGRRHERTQERSGEGDPGRLRPGEGPQLPEPGAVALEPGPLGARVAAQAGGGEQHESEQQGGRAAAHELHPPGRDGIVSLQRDEGVRRPRQAERRAQTADAALGGGLAVEQAADLPVVQGGGLDRRRPPVGAIERREDRQRRELRDAARDQHRRRAALRLVGAARERGQAERQRPGRVPDHDQAQARLRDGPHGSAARLDDLAPRRHACARQPARSQPQPAGRVGHGSQLDQPAAQVQLRERERARRRAGPEPAQGRRRRPIDPAVAARRRRPQPRRREAALRDGHRFERRPQAAVGGDGRSADDPSEGRGGDGDADRDEAAPARPGARPRHRHPKRRPSRPRSGSQIGANIQPAPMFAGRADADKRRCASAVFTSCDQRPGTTPPTRVSKGA